MKLKDIQQIVAIFMVVREILKNEELRDALGVVVDVLEESFKRVPGEFPENILDKIQDILNLDDDTDVVVDAADLAAVLNSNGEEE